jgi:putative Holliday junction resolvase
VTCHEQDERFTTAEAGRVLLAADLSRAKRRRVIDQQAAALILQGWLDGSRRSK